MIKHGEWGLGLHGIMHHVLRGVQKPTATICDRGAVLSDCCVGLKAGHWVGLGAAQPQNRNQ